MHTKDPDEKLPDTKPDRAKPGNLEPPPKKAKSTEKSGNLEPPPPAAPIKPLL